MQAFIGVVVKRLISRDDHAAFTDTFVLGEIKKSTWISTMVSGARSHAEWAVWEDNVVRCANAELKDGAEF